MNRGVTIMQQKPQKGWLSRWTRKQWSRHWFVLENGSLTYYRGPAAELCSFLDGVLDLSLIKHIEVQQQDQTANNHHSINNSNHHHHIQHHYHSNNNNSNHLLSNQTNINGICNQNNSNNHNQTQQFTFSLKMWNGECHLLGASSAAERSLWLDAIHACTNGDVDDDAATDSASSSDSSPTSNLSAKSTDIGRTLCGLNSRYQANQQKSMINSQQEQENQEQQMSLDHLTLSLRSIKRREQDVLLQLDNNGNNKNSGANSNDSNGNANNSDSAKSSLNQIQLKQDVIVHDFRQAGATRYFSKKQDVSREEQPMQQDTSIISQLQQEKLSSVNHSTSIKDLFSQQHQQQQQEEQNSSQMKKDNESQAFKRRLMCVSAARSASSIDHLIEPKLITRQKQKQTSALYSSCLSHQNDDLSESDDTEDDNGDEDDDEDENENENDEDKDDAKGEGENDARGDELEERDLGGEIDDGEQDEGANSDKEKKEDKNCSDRDENRSKDIGVLDKGRINMPRKGNSSIKSDCRMAPVINGSTREVAPSDGQQTSVQKQKKRVTFDLSLSSHYQPTSSDSSSSSSSSESDDSSLSSSSTDSSLTSSSSSSSSSSDDEGETSAILDQERISRMSSLSRDLMSHVNVPPRTSSHQQQVTTSMISSRERLENDKSMVHCGSISSSLNSKLSQRDDNESDDCELVRDLINKRRSRLSSKERITNTIKVPVDSLIDHPMDTSAEDNQGSKLTATNSLFDNTETIHRLGALTGEIGITENGCGRSLSDDIDISCLSEATSRREKEDVSIEGCPNQLNQELEEQVRRRTGELELKLEEAQKSIGVLELKLNNSYVNYGQLELSYKRLQNDLVEGDELLKSDLARLQLKVDELTKELSANERKLIEAQDRLAKFEVEKEENLKARSTIETPNWLRVSQEVATNNVKTTNLTSSSTTKTTLTTAHHQPPNQLHHHHHQPLLLMHHVKHTLAVNQQTLGLKLLNHSKQIQRKLNELELKVDKIHSTSTNNALDETIQQRHTALDTPKKTVEASN